MNGCKVDAAPHRHLSICLGLAPSICLPGLRGFACEVAAVPGAGVAAAARWHGAGRSAGRRGLGAPGVDAEGRDGAIRTHQPGSRAGVLLSYRGPLAREDHHIISHRWVQHPRRGEERPTGGDVMSRRGGGWRHQRSEDERPRLRWLAWTPAAPASCSPAEEQPKQLTLAGEAFAGSPERMASG